MAMCFGGSTSALGFESTSTAKNALYQQVHQDVQVQEDLDASGGTWIYHPVDKDESLTELVVRGLPNGDHAHLWFAGIMV